jgi:hypothetical protein
MELDAALQNRGLDSEKPQKCEILPPDGRPAGPGGAVEPAEGETGAFSFA